jgi:NCAIR mutase (PurE)-related protein
MQDIIRKLSERFLQGELQPGDFLRQLTPFLPQGNSREQIAHVGEAQLDLERGQRCGFPEVVFSEGKSIESLEKIFQSLTTHGINVLATRMSADKGDYLLGKFPTGRYNPIGRTFRIPPESGEPKRVGKVAVITAGTSDMPVAEEARETADWTGAETILIHDIGVAGPHRLQANRPLFEDADAIVVCAGMEGALPSVVGGYVSCPVVAVPTSLGYGASFGGLSALMTMLNSCASGIGVVNIDNGFGAGYLASLINRL